MLVVVPTAKTEKEYKSTTAYQCISNLANYFDGIEGESYFKSSKYGILIKAENKKGLSELYNSVIAENPNHDIITFIHDDLEIHDQFFHEKLKRAHMQNAIVGLAGATTQNYTTPSPSVWHLSKEKAGDARGIVSHFIPKGFQNVEQSHFNSAYFGPTPDRVVVIDGLFMSINVRSFVEKSVKFDEDFKFHHYDMAMCVDAIRKGLTIAVWPIFCVHHGLGEFNNPEWKESDAKFKVKYGNTIHKV